MQTTSISRFPYVLFEIFAAAALGSALMSALWLGAGCSRSSASGTPTAGGIRIFGWGAFTRAMRDATTDRRGAGTPTTTARGLARTGAGAGTATLRRVVSTYEAHFKGLGGLTYARQRKLHGRRYLKRLGLDVQKAEFHSGFVNAFGLSLGARTVLGTRGFVVVPAREHRSRTHWRHAGQGPSNLYYRVFAANLPVFVSADSILHAWHRAFDGLVANLEASELVPAFKKMLVQTLSKLDRGTQAGRDAYIYLAVARKLLDRKYLPHNQRWWPARTTIPAVRTLLAAIARRRVTGIWLMGETMRLDARQFSPTGRYAKDPDLAAYFKAMTWLAQVELLLHHPRRRVAWQARQEAAARTLVRAMSAGKAFPLYKRLERAYSVLIGRPMAITPVGLLALCNRAGLSGCEGEGRDMAAQYLKQAAPPYSVRFYAPKRGAVRLSLFPRRFAYDVWVTARTTTPRLPPLRAYGRSMARDLDIAFALGSDRALERLGGEMGLAHRQHLPAALEAARRTLNAVPPSKISDSVYSHWLEAIMALSKTDVSENLPRVMRTATWQDRKLEAALGSLVELRQDAGPLVRPSRGGKGCQYPKGYVEPVPELFRSVARAAARLERLFAVGNKRNKVRRLFLKHWQRIMARLARLAELQRTGKPMRKKDLGFLSHTVDRHAYLYSGGRSYDGWYPRLFWNGGWEAKVQGGPASKYGRTGGSQSKLALTVLHLDVDRHRALQAAVGHMGLMVVAIDVGGKTALYGGPAYNYYSFERKLSKRVGPAQWKSHVTHAPGLLPARPRFARAYHAR